MRTAESSNEEAASSASNIATWEHFQHGSDIGIRGVGASKEQAFEQAALALTAVLTDPELVRQSESVSIRCSGPDDEYLFLDWINALIFEMATRKLLFGRFQVSLRGMELSATAWGEAVDVARHHPAVEPKGATLTCLEVRRIPEDRWLAQCVIDV